MIAILVITQILLGFLLLLNAMMVIGNIGKPRKPLTASTANTILIINLVWAGISLATAFALLDSR